MPHGMGERTPYSKNPRHLGATGTKPRSCPGRRPRSPLFADGPRTNPARAFAVCSPVGLYLRGGHNRPFAQRRARPPGYTKAVAVSFRPQFILRMSKVNIKRTVENIRANTTVYSPIVEVVVNAL